MLDEMTLQNASKFATFLEYENPCSFFRFSFRATFSLTDALAYVDIDQGIHSGETNLNEMKNEKNYMGFHIPKIWQILKHFAMSFNQAKTSYF